jgi:hypothetical protein
MMSKLTTPESIEAKTADIEADTKRFIDLTPTWQQILPTWLNLYRMAVRGEVGDPHLVKNNAESEFRTMAEAADKWNAHCKALSAGEFHLVEGPAPSKELQS